MKTKFMILLAAFGLAGASVRAQTTVLDETFDDTSGFTIGNAIATFDTFFSDGTADYLGLAGTSPDWGGDTAPSVKAYTGLTGTYLTGQDMDGEGAASLFTFTWSGLDITGLTDIEFSGDFAEFLDTPGDIDPTDQLFVEAQIDGGGFTKILEFTPGSFATTVNGFFEFGAFTLGTAAQNFSADIVGTGSSLDLRLTADLDSGDEDFAVDNFQVTAIPEPSSIILMGLVGLAAVVAVRKHKKS